MGTRWRPTPTAVETRNNLTAVCTPPAGVWRPTTTVVEIRNIDVVMRINRTAKPATDLHRGRDRNSMGVPVRA